MQRGQLESPVRVDYSIIGDILFVRGMSSIQTHHMMQVAHSVRYEGDIIIEGSLQQAGYCYQWVREGLAWSANMISDEDLKRYIFWARLKDSAWTYRDIYRPQTLEFMEDWRHDENPFKR